MNDFDIPLNGESSLIANPQELIADSGLGGTDLSGDLSNSSSMLPTLEADILRYEAEELNLSSYLIESNNASSGGKHISLLDSDRNSGTASGVFNGEAGTYQVNVGFYDENDGVSSAEVTVGGEVQNFKFDQDLLGDAPKSATLSERMTHSAVKLQPGDTFEIAGKSNLGEYAGFDYIEFTPLNTETPESKQTNTEIEESTYYVSPNGSNDNPGTKAQPWKTIDYAVSKDSTVKAGDTVLVQPGVYTELITLDKSGNKELGHITLKADGEVTLRDPDPINGDFREGVIQSAGNGYWIIDGFRIENTSWAGIALRDANNMIVQNNHTFETGASGIIVLPESYYKGGDAEVTSQDIKVLDNTIERANWRWTGRGDTRGTQEALSIWGVDGFEVANNIVTEGKREGIDAKTGSRNGSIHHNTVTGVAKVSGTAGGYNGGPAIYVDGNRADTFNIDIYNNLVNNNTSEGIVINDEEPGAGDVRDVRVYNNVISGNGTQGVNSGAGIMIGSNVKDIEIINNTLSGNVQSFLIDGSDFFEGDRISNVVLRNNIFANPTYRNGFIEDADDIVLDNNLFTDNVDKFEQGNKVNNIKEINNLQVDSVGFSNSKANDYRLNSDSPGIDTGTNSIPNYLTTDQDGKQRQIGKAVDIGSFEFGTSNGKPSPVKMTDNSDQNTDTKVRQDSSNEENIVLRNRFF